MTDEIMHSIPIPGPVGTPPTEAVKSAVASLSQACQAWPHQDGSASGMACMAVMNPTWVPLPWNYVGLSSIALIVLAAYLLMKVFCDWPLRFYEGVIEPKLFPEQARKRGQRRQARIAMLRAAAEQRATRIRWKNIPE